MIRSRRRLLAARARVPSALLVVATWIAACSPAQQDNHSDHESKAGWRIAFADDGSGDWTDNWFLEGDRATVENTPDGFILTAGHPAHGDSSHAVLWTHAEFGGDLKIEYDYTRLDTMVSVNAVNILYIQATGLGTEDSPIDITRSTESRRVPTMSKYYLGMNTLHISYSTTGPRRSHYVSARRYPATSQEAFPDETQFQPIYEDVPLFEPGRTYHITVVKEGGRLSMLAESGDVSRRFEWDTRQFPEVDIGRIGLRHMRGRSSQYGGFTVYSRN